MLLLIQFPAVEQSFLGAPDRQMMETAFKYRADITGGTADPVLFLDFDDRTMSKRDGAAPFAPPLATVPRGLIAALLDFIRGAPPSRGPPAVILDVDVAQPASDGDVGVEKLRAALSSWASSKTAPPLILVREAYPASSFGLDEPGEVLPDSPYDQIVRPATNIFWSEATVLSDMNGVIREFSPFECVNSSAGVTPLYSAALLAYQFSETDRTALDRAPARRWMAVAASRCQNPARPQLRHGERIDYHLSMDQNFEGRVWPPLSPHWPGFATCPNADPRVLRRISAIDVVDAMASGQGASPALLCRHTVIIGGTNASASDFVQTPLNEMNGSAVLANAVRGLQLTHGGLTLIPLPAQILLLLVVSLAISASAAATSRARKRYLRLRSNAQKERLSHRLIILPLNPVLLNGFIALGAHYAGVALLFFSLDLGLWGFLSAPAFAAAITETIQEFTDG